MSTQTSKANRKAVFLLFAGAVCVANAWLARHAPGWLMAPATTPPEWPVLVDLLLALPLAYLVVFRRDGRRAWIGAALLAVSGITLAGWIVPADSQQWLGSLRLLRNFLAVLLVLGEIALAVGLVRLVLHGLRTERDPEQAIAASLRARLGDSPVVPLLAFEVRLWFYALFAGRRPLCFAGDEHFGYARKDGHASNLQGFMLLVAIELPLLHVLLTLFGSARVAWIVSLLSAWGLCFLLAEYRATLRRPISLDADALYVRYGLSAELRVPRERIAVACAHDRPVRRRAPGVVRYCDAGAPNVRIELAPAIEVPGWLGGSRRIGTLYLGVDEPARLIAGLERSQPVGSGVAERSA
ncbi:hypothetical protein [Dokdonella sp.]|uniref:hypothetical protein n=1 Tax=Dokdonella sp. TaxID=2291710 RepID=UPI0037835C5C